MAFREVEVVEVKEVLRQWLRGKGYREAARLGQVERKTARRYVEAAVALGLCRRGGEEQLTDELVGGVVASVRSSGPGIRGRSWAKCVKHKEFLDVQLKKGLTLTKTHVLLQRREGSAVAYRTLHRFATEELGFHRRAPTVRVDDGKPGGEVQVDFGRLGLLRDEQTGRKRYVWALVFTACYSRHMFLWLCFRQQLEDVIAGFEAAWAFFGGMFEVVIPDNMKPIVDRADPCDPRFNVGFLEYAQARGFTADPARVRHPKDKPRVERMVPYARDSFFAGEDFQSLEEAQEAAEVWCRTQAGERRHGTTQKHPFEVFAAEEQAHLLPAPTAPYDVPDYGDALVGDDHHITFGNALYSVPTEYIGERVEVRADRHLVRMYLKGKLVKTHARKPAGGRSTDPNDYPEEVRAYATRNTEGFEARAREAGPNVGEYLRRLLDCPAPWTRMRLAYRLLGLVKRYGATRVDAACAKALELDVVDVMRIERMLERALETAPAASVAQAGGSASTLRFLRPESDFATCRPPASPGGRDE